MQCEAELVRRLKEGESLAYAEFADRYGSRIYDALCWQCGDRTAAEDLAQETVVAVYRGIGGFKGGSSLYSWVYRIARRIAGKRRSRSYVPFESLAEFEALDDTDEQARRAMLRGSVREALRALPDGQRESVVLHSLQGLSHSETARALGRPLGTVKWQIAQGLVTLKCELQRIGVNADEL